MHALRIEAEGLTTSFRYPHFLMGRQPSFRMPPPATIYGHACSAAGRFLDPAELQFGYVFRHDGIGDDLELLHIASVGGGKLPGAAKLPKNLDVTTNPTPREVLLHPRLTLYLAAPDAALDELEHAFREPRYVVTLGRSQDLVAYRSVQRVELQERESAYFEWTLLPWSYRRRTNDGLGVTMPRFIDPTDRRQVTWSPFVLLEGRIHTVTSALGNSPRSGLLSRTDDAERWWVDPDTPVIHGLNRAVVWHRFGGGDPDELTFVASTAGSLG